MNNKPKKSGSKIIIIVLVLLIFLTANSWFPIPAKFLLVKDNIGKSDCIVVLGGDMEPRFKEAIKLYNEGMAENILFSVIPEPEDKGGFGSDPVYFMLGVYGVEQLSQKDLALRAFKYLGKDSKNIYFTDSKVTSTYEEALATKDFMLKKGWRSLIIVTNGYHMRRALINFNLVFNKTGIKIYNCTADKDSIHPEAWWRKENHVKIVLQEYLSIVHNLIYRFVLNKKKTSFDT